MIVFSLLSWLIYATVRGSVVIVLVAAVLAIAGRRIGARWRLALWLIVLVRLAVPFAPASSLSIFNVLPLKEPEVIASLHRAPVPAAAATTLAIQESDVSAAMMWIAAIWLAGVVLLFARVIIATVRVHRAVRVARRVGGERRDLLALIDDARRHLRIRRRVRAIECDGVRTPALHGIINPILLLPAGFGSTFDVRETRHVVLHELWHLRRHDIALNWLMSAVQIFHWFNPAVWFAISRIGEERELVCDELALSCLEEDERSSYGETILKLLDRFRAVAPVPALAGIVNHKEMMKRRLMMIASFRNRTRFSLLFLAALALVAAVGFTDPTRIERRVVQKLSAESMEALKPLHDPLSFDLDNATLADVITTLSNKTGVVVKQAPEIATSRAQSARFTIHAENVPARAVLNETLSPFGLETAIEGNGLTIVAAPPREAKEIDEEMAATDPHVVHEEERHIVMKQDGADHSETMMFRHGAPESLPADGKSHRELSLRISRDGKETSGKMTVDIVAPPVK